MLKQLTYVGCFGFVVAIVGVLCLQHQVAIGPVVLALTIVPLLGLFFAKKSFKGAFPDLIFGAIDTGILVIPALCGGIMYGVAGAIAGGVIGDALTDGIAGFFEGSIAKWLREKGIQESRKKGVLAGYPVIDFKVILYDGSFHDVDSSDIAFKIAGSLAFKDAASKAKPVLLEPMMSLVVLSPDEYLGDIVSDIRTRRGKIEEMDMRGGSRILKTTVPLAEMFGYATTLRTLTQGRGVFSMEYYQYEPTPPSVMEEIIARIEGRIPATR